VDLIIIPDVVVVFPTIKFYTINLAFEISFDLFSFLSTNLTFGEFLKDLIRFVPTAILVSATTHLVLLVPAPDPDAGGLDRH
jgi:hypothetical protein